MADICTLYITCTNDQEAGLIATALVQEKLAACGNILRSVTSIYEWQGKMQTDHEVALLLKTTRSVADQAIARAKELHSYETPCIVCWPVVTGHEDYLAWVSTQTR